MRDELETLFSDFDRRAISRRQLLQALGVAAVGAPFAAAVGQGRCIRALGTPACDTTAIPPVFASTGWKTVALDHLSAQVADYQKEAAFYTALIGWKLRSDDGKQAVMDIGDFGTVILRQAAPNAFPAPDTTGRGGRPGRARTPAHAVFDSFCFGIAPWDATKVESELRKRGLNPVADNDGKGFESFHVKDPDGFDLQISNATAKNRRTTPANATLAAPLPFEPTGWKTVWLDHISFGVTNYKESASFYCNLLGWKPTYDEGSQNECMIGDVGNIIIRGGNPLVPGGGRGGGRGGAASGEAGPPAPATGVRRASIGHISFGVQPWDTDAIKEGLEKRGLNARVDTSTGDDIHVAAYKSYHTTTPNGFDLQISAVTHDTRLTLPTAVTPRKPGH
jgi:catechol 2,3-dioxygenase-like lactoylglutathione lyase family enzyme